MKTLNAMLNGALMTPSYPEFLEQAIPILAYDVVNGKTDCDDLDDMMRDALVESETDENECMIKEFLSRFGDIASHMDRNDKTEDNFLIAKFSDGKLVKQVDKNGRLYKAWLQRDERYGKMSEFKVRLQNYINKNKHE